MKGKSGLVLYLITLFCISSNIISAQINQDLLYKIYVAHSKHENDSLMKEFLQSIKLIVKGEENELKFQGDGGFGFGADNSNTKEQYNVDAEIAVKRGSFPTEFKFIAGISTLLSDKKFTENVSNIYMSYDFHINDNLHFENFGFINRFSDNYLGVDQRYEIGIGTIWEYWSEKLNTQGEETKTSLDNTAAFMEANSFKATYPSLISDAVLKDNEISSIIRSYNRIKKSNIKTNSRVRAGILTGVLFELEKISFSDSLLTDTVRNGANVRAFKEASFDPTKKIRITLRPFIELRGKNTWKFKFKPYFKFPTPFKWYETDSYNGQTFKRFDLRIDLESSLELSIAGNSDSGKNAAIELTYKYYFDNAPERKFFEGKDPSGKDLVLTANDHHHMFRMTFKVNF